VIERDPFRPHECPWCDGLGYVPCHGDDGEIELYGCGPCGGRWNREGSGRLLVRFVEEAKP
jgi:hypothetical protein